MAVWDYITANFNRPQVNLDIPSVQYRESALQNMASNVPVSRPVEPVPSNQATFSNTGVDTYQPNITQSFIPLDVQSNSASGKFVSGSEPYLDTINAVAKQYGLNPNMMLGMLATESNFNPNARNAKSGAIGLGQFLPSTAKQYGIDPTDPYQSIKGMGAYLNDLSKMFNGNQEKMIASYNFGQGNVMKGRQYPLETQNYLKKVFSYM